MPDGSRFFQISRAKPTHSFLTLLSKWTRISHSKDKDSGVLRNVLILNCYTAQKPERRKSTNCLCLRVCVCVCVCLFFVLSSRNQRTTRNVTTLLPEVLQSHYWTSKTVDCVRHTQPYATFNFQTDISNTSSVEGNGCVLKIIWKGSEVKWSEV